MVHEPASSDCRLGIDELHTLIATACHQLDLVEQETNEDWSDLSSTENHCDSNLDDQECNDFESFISKPLILHLLISRNDQYLCSECDFHCEFYQTFYEHCIKEHKSSKNNFKDKNSSKVLYTCTKCLFLHFNYKGFASHSTSKHKCPTSEALQCIPITNADAESYLQSFLKTSESRQRKHAVKLLRFFSTEKKKILSNQSSNHFQDEESQEMSCLVCGFKSEFVYYLEDHYQKLHNMNGPERDSLDYMFHCKKCSFLTSSYKKLHLHANLHKVLHHNGLTNGRTPLKKTICENFPLNTVEGDNTDVIANDLAPTSANCKLLHCNSCDFSTTSISMILNHLRSAHTTKEYPAFVTKHVERSSRENIIEVLLKSEMIDSRWMNGWMNEKCTFLIKKPLYCCDFCNFNSASYKIIAAHYQCTHKHINFSSSRLNVFESLFISDADNSKRMLCRQSTLFQCHHCRAYSSCFFKNMLDHYMSEHADLNTHRSSDAISAEIKSSLVTRCLKCEEFYSDPNAMLLHYNEKHAAEVVTFSLHFQTDTEISAVCRFCDHVCLSIAELYEHMKNHREKFLATFEDSHIVGYCCSKCRRVFRHKRFLLYHYSRLHVEWNDYSFKHSDFPDTYFRKKLPNTVINITDADENLKPLSLFDSVVSSTCQSSDVNEVSISLNTSASSDIALSCGSSSSKEKFLAARKRKIVSTCSHQTYIDKNPLLYKKHTETLHNRKEPYKCPHCLNSYICEVVLRMHVRKKHKFANPVPDSISPQKENVPPNQKRIIFSCSHKNIQTKNPELYQTHIIKKHSQSKPYHCPKCNRIYECQSIFTLHLRKKHQLDLNEQKVRRYRRVLRQNKSDIFAPAVDLSDSPKPPSLEYHQSKDYGTSKSVKTREGFWKCLYCKRMLKSYAVLRRHNIRDHPNNRTLRCRWCDYLCRTNVQLTNHMRIHSKFVAERMKVLREICRNNRDNAISKKKKDEEKKTDALSSVVSAEKSIPYNEAPYKFAVDEVVPPVSIQRAKKSIRKVSDFKATKTIPVVQEPKRPVQYSYTSIGTLRCNCCDFTCTQKSRMQWHLKSVHTSKKMHNCKFCTFQNVLYHEVESHLIVHHKMERNHEVAIESCVLFVADKNADEEQQDSIDSVYTPQPSLPIINNKEMKTGSTSFFSGAIESDLTFSRKSSGDTPFKCGYCSAQLLSTYETECHMMRHERCVMNNSSDLNETAMIFKKFTFLL